MKFNTMPGEGRSERRDFWEKKKFTEELREIVDSRKLDLENTSKSGGRRIKGNGREGGVSGVWMFSLHTKTLLRKINLKRRKKKGSEWGSCTFPPQTDVMHKKRLEGGLRCFLFPPESWLGKVKEWK